MVSVVLLKLFIAWQLYLTKKTIRRPSTKISFFSNTREAAVQITIALVFPAFLITSSLRLFGTRTGKVSARYGPRYVSVLSVQQEVSLEVVIIPAYSDFAETVLASIVVSQVLSRVKVNYIMAFGIVFCGLASFLLAISMDPYTTYW